MTLFETLPLYENEEKLKRDIYNNPTVLRQGSELGWASGRTELSVAYGVPGYPAGRVDVFAIRSDGYPALIEAKLSSNSEVTNSVVSQLLRYRHGFLRTMTATSVADFSLNPLSDTAKKGLDAFITNKRVRLVFITDSAPIELVIAAASLKSAGMDVDLLEVRRGAFDNVRSQRVSLDPIERHGDWSELPTLLQRVTEASYVIKNGLARATLLPSPPSGFFRVFDSPADDTSGIRHQVDPHRGEGNMGVMPNWDYLSSLGNPYPTDPDHDSTVRTTPQWKPWILVGYHLWKILVDKGEFVRSRDHHRLAASLLDAAAPVVYDHNWKRHFTKTVRDVLFDLHLYNMADVSTNASRSDEVAVPTDAAMAAISAASLR